MHMQLFIKAMHQYRGIAINLDQLNSPLELYKSFQ